MGRVLTETGCFDGLDAPAAAKVTTATLRMELGNTSNVKWFAGIGRVQEAEEVRTMALTRVFKKTVVARVERDPAFAKALLDEAATLFLSGEPETARLILRDLVNATLGFEQLAKLTDTPSKSLHRMLSPKGNPSMDNLAAIFGALRKRLKVGIKAQTVDFRKVA
jgi:DNA-binding phage protein